MDGREVLEPARLWLARVKVEGTAKARDRAHPPAARGCGDNEALGAHRTRLAGAAAGMRRHSDLSEDDMVAGYFFFFWRPTLRGRPGPIEGFDGWEGGEMVMAESVRCVVPQAALFFFFSNSSCRVDLKF